MKCNLCHIGKSNIHPIFGYLPCDKCLNKHRKLGGSSPQVEFTSESIKEQRKQYRQDIMPFHNRGELDKAWVDRYGAEKAKQRGFSDEEIRNAKFVWDGIDEYYKGHNHN